MNILYYLVNSEDIWAYIFMTNLSEGTYASIHVMDADDWEIDKEEAEVAKECPEVAEQWDNISRAWKVKYTGHEEKPEVLTIDVTYHKDFDIRPLDEQNKE